MVRVWYIARHSRLIAIRLRNRSFRSFSLAAQHCAAMMGWSLPSEPIMRMASQGSPRGGV
jgi:hypothetical protein